MSNHWYDKEGKPAYTIIGTNGKERNCTLRDARKLSLVPSVTTVTSILAKPGLIGWQMEQVIEAAFSSPRQAIGEEYEDYVKRIIFTSNQKSRQAADKGSKLHDKLEKYFKEDFSESLDETEWAFIKPVLKAVDSVLPTSGETGEIINWKAERSFCSPLGYGGKVDLCCLDNKHPVVLDFKTKNTTDPKKFYKYDEHLMQLAAYREGLGIPTARCFDLYFSSEVPGILELHEWKEEELQKGFKMFTNLLEYWKLSNQYDPTIVEVSNATN
jgi:uncharacterized protein Usg